MNCGLSPRCPAVTTALLRCEISGHAGRTGQASDRFGEFSECCGDPQLRAGVGSEFVVAAAQICTKACPAIITCAVQSV